MKRTKVVNYDINTGKVLQGVIVFFGVKNNPYGNGWLMISQESLREIARDKDIKGETFRVFLYIIGILDFENWIHIPQKEIAEYLGMHKTVVSRSIKKLIDKEIIVKGDKLGKSYIFRFNPNFGWKGKVKNLDEYREEKYKEEIDKLKKQINKENNLVLKILSEKYDIPLDKIKKFLEENAEVK